MTIKKDFFCRPAPELAPLLLGKYLCRRLENGEVLRLMITETEAYYGEEDSACHAHRGKTPRNALLYGECGVAYVYLCYGIHSLMNVISGEEGHPEGVLLRGVQGFSGPGKLTKYMKIDRAFNGVALSEENGLWIEDSGKEAEYETAARVGIDYADECDRARPWRFIFKGYKDI